MTRLAHRLRDACDEWVERAEDHDAGRRDGTGRRTEKWYQHDYEMEKRRRKREGIRREKKERERNAGKDGEDGYVEAMMSGGRGGGGGSMRGGNGGDPFDDPPALEGVGPQALPMEELANEPGSDRASRNGSHLPVEDHRSRRAGGTPSRHGSHVRAEDRGQGPQGSRIPGPTISPMPSEHSISSMRAQVSRRHDGARARIRSPAGRGPPLDDSEDEEPHHSDDEASGPEEEGGGGSAARRARGAAVADREGPPSGLRGGGADGIIDVGDLDLEESGDEENFADAVEYNEHEDFDDEYTTGFRLSKQYIGDEDTTAKDGATDPQENLLDVDDRRSKAKKEQPTEEASEQLHGEQDQLHDDLYAKMGSRERRPYSIVEGMPAAEMTEDRSRKEFPQRTPRLYAIPRVGESTRLRCTDAAGNSGKSISQHDTYFRGLSLTHHQVLAKSARVLRLAERS